MKRYWPLAFLIVLLVALVARPTSQRLRLALPSARILPEPVEIVEAPASTPPVAAESAAPAETAPPAPDESAESAMKGSSVGKALLWLARHQNEDGSWGDVPATIGGRTIGRTGVTSLALLSFLGAGYSHLSRDEYDGDKTMGVVVKKALQWMLKDQSEDGTFQSGHDVGFDQVLATLARCEAYGMTGSTYLKEPAEKAIEALLRMQGSDGSWGGAEPTSWAMKALFSAELSELPWPKSACDRALQYIGTAPHPGNLHNRILLTKDRGSVSEEAEALASTLPQGDGQDFCDWFHASHGIFQFDGPDGPLWKKFNEPLKEAILPLQNRDGSWTGGTLSHTIVRSSLAQLTLQVYYRYSNTFGAR